MKAGVKLQANRADIKVPYNSSPEVVDWNEDGLLDLLVGYDGNGAVGGVWLYLNSGTTTQYQFTTYTALEADGQVIDYLRVQIQVADLNYDGKKDLVLGNGLIPASRIYFYENIGTNASPELKQEVALLMKDNSPIGPEYDIYFCAADWNEDGGFDILWTDYDGSALYLCLGDVPVEINQIGKISSSDIIKNHRIQNGLFRATILLGSQKYIKIDMVTADGRKVDTKDIGNLHTGKHEIDIDLNRHPSGVYFFRLFADNICEESKRLLFVK